MFYLQLYVKKQNNMEMDKWVISNGSGIESLYDKNNNYYKYTIYDKQDINFYDFLEYLENFVEDDPENIKKILSRIPEDKIQNYLRTKKLNKIKKKLNK